MKKTITAILKICFILILATALAFGAFRVGLIGWILETKAGYGFYHWATTSLEIYGCESSEDFLIDTVLFMMLIISYGTCWLLGRYIKKRKTENGCTR